MSDLNPTWEECRCGWGRQAWLDGLAGQQDRAEREPEYDPFKFGSGYDSLETGQALHGWLLDLDSPHPWESFTSLYAFITDSVIPLDHELTEIFAQHNWTDPIGITKLAFWLDCELEDSRKSAREYAMRATAAVAS